MRSRMRRAGRRTGRTRRRRRRATQRDRRRPGGGHPAERNRSRRGARWRKCSSGIVLRPPQEHMRRDRRRRSHLSEKSSSMVGARPAEARRRTFSRMIPATERPSTVLVLREVEMVAFGWKPARTTAGGRFQSCHPANIAATWVESVQASAFACGPLAIIHSSKYPRGPAGVRPRPRSRCPSGAACNAVHAD